MEFMWRVTMKQLKHLFLIGMFGTLATAASAETVTDYIDGYCSSEGLDAAQCACVQTEFQARTNDLDPADAEAIALFVGQPGLAPQVMMTAMQSLDQTRLPALMMSIDPIMSEVAAACTGPATPTFVDDRSLPTRDRYIATCEIDIDFPGVCDCMADAIAQNLEPLMFDLVTDIRAAEAAGEEDAFETVANERGLSVQEAEDALAIYSGSLVSSIGPMMACAPDEIKQMMQGGQAGMSGMVVPTE
jgi:hypothetical protein